MKSTSQEIKEIRRVGRCTVGFCREYLGSASLDGFKHHVTYIHGINWETFLKCYTIAEDQDGNNYEWSQLTESEKIEVTK